MSMILQNVNEISILEMQKSAGFELGSCMEDSHVWLCHHSGRLKMPIKEEVVVVVVEEEVEVEEVY